MNDLPKIARIARAAPVEFRYARTCYGHLAGEVAVELLDMIIKQRWLRPAKQGYELTSLGEIKLEALGVDVDAARARRRVFARPCLDLTQRRPHLAGALGDAVLDAFVARHWVQRQRRSRAVDITPAGRESFQRIFGVSS